MGFLDSVITPNSNKKESIPTSKSSGFLDSVVPPSSSKVNNPQPTSTTTPSVASSTPPAKTPYFSAVDKQGNSFGFSDTETDPSGRALFAYRKPGDTSTTTDKTRVAPTFDPRIPQKLTKDQYYNPRMVKNVAEIKQQLGGSFNDELDHKIALAVGGSNKDENLQSIPKEQNRAYGKTEEELARQVANGEISYFDAQVADAKQKGLPLPFTGVKPGIIDTVKDYAGKAVDAVKDLIVPKTAEAETQSSGGFLDSVVKPHVSQVTKPQPETFGNALYEAANPNKLLAPDQTNATQTSTIPSGKTFNVGEYLFSPKGSVDYPRMPFYSEDQQKSLGKIYGPRIITGTASIINNFMVGLVDAVAQTGVDVASAGDQIFNHGNGEVKLPFNPTRIGLSKEDVALNGKVKALGQSTIDHLNELDKESPNTPNLNLAKTFFDKIFTRAIINPIVSGDVAKQASQTILNWSKSSPQLGLSATELNNLSPEDAVKETAKRFFDRVQEINPEGAPIQNLSKYQQRQISQLVDETKSLGQAFSEGSIPKLNPLGRFFDDLAIKLNQDVANIGETTSLTEGKINPAEDTLPGYRTTPGQPHPVGLSIQNVEPVGFGDKNEKPLYHATTPENAEEILHNGFDTSRHTPSSYKAYGDVVNLSEDPKIANEMGNEANMTKNSTTLVAIPKPDLNYYNLPNGINSPEGEELQKIAWKAEGVNDNAIKDYLTSQGYDGIKTNIPEEGTIIFDPKDVSFSKSLSGVENSTNIESILSQKDISEPFTASEMSEFNRNSYSNVNWNRDFKDSINNVLIDSKLKSVPQELQPAFNKFLTDYKSLYVNWLNIRASNPSSAVTGRANFNYNRQSKLNNREQKVTNEMRMLKDRFVKIAGQYNKSIQGPQPSAEQKRQITRDYNDKYITVGSKVIDQHGTGVVKKVNKNTYTIQFKDGYTMTRDKYFVQAESYEKPINNTTEESENTSNKVQTIPQKESPVDTKIRELDTERMALQDTLENHPARALVKHVNPKTGELPEALGTGRSKFGRVGDQLANDLGFNSSEDARLSYMNYKLLQKRLVSMRESIKTMRDLRSENRKEDKDAKSLGLLMNKTAKQSEKLIADVVTKKLPETKAILRKNQAQITSRVNQTMQALKKQKSVLDRSTPQTGLEALENSQPITLEDHDRMNNNFSYQKIIIDTNTPVKYKVGIIDYLRTPDRVLKKLGLNHIADSLRKGYENYILELPLHLEVIKDWADRAGSEEANRRIFDWLDGQQNRDFHAGKKFVPLTPNELYIGREIRAYLKDWADRLGLPDDNTISHYITHIFNLGENEKEFPEEIADLITDKVPGSVYDPFLLKRLGKKGYIHDTWKSLEAYAKRAVRKANMDPALAQLKDASTRLEKSQVKYLERLGARVNLRPTEIDNLVDNTIKQFIGYKLGGRPVALLSRKIRQVVFRSMLGLNVGSAVKNLTQGVNTFAKLGPKYTTIGYLKLLTKIGNKELEEQGVLSQDFIQDRTLTATKKMLEKADKTLFFFFDTAEKINRGAAYWGAKAKAIDSGSSEAEAIKYAKKVVRDTQFQFGSIDTPVGLNSDLTKLFTQFMSFGVKQTEFASEMIKAREWWGIFRYIFGSFVVVATIGKIFNIKASDFVPGYSVFSRFDQIPPGLALPWEITKALVNAPDQYGKPRDIPTKLKDVAGAVPYPVKVQAEKTYKGLKTYFDPTKDIKQSPLTATQAAVLGPKGLPPAHPELQQSKTEESQGRTQAKSDAETEYTRLKALPQDQASSEFEKLLTDNPTLAKKVSDLASKPVLTTPEKGLMFLGVKNGRRAQAIFDAIQKLGSQEEKANYYQNLIDKKVITKDVNDQLLQLLGQVK